MQDLQQLYSQLDIVNYLGHICNDPKLLLNKQNRAVADDFIDRLHKIIYVAVENLAIQGDIDDITDVSINMFLEDYPDQQDYFNTHNGMQFVQDVKDLSESSSFNRSLQNIKKYTLLRNYEKHGFSVKFLYDTDLVDPELISKRSREFEEMSIATIQLAVKEKLNSLTGVVIDSSTDNISFEANEGIFDVIEKYKKEPLYGHPFQSHLYNAIFRGMLGKKVMLRSGSTGSGKTRTMLGDMCEISAVKMYDVNKEIWVENPRPVSSTFISTELDKEEVQTCLLAIVSGVPENKIKNGLYDEDVERRLNYAAEVIEQSQMHMHYIENFTMGEIENKIEHDIASKDTGFVFFDYIQITPALANEYRQLFGYVLREDQVLNLIVTKLKNIANNYDIFLMSATQINRNYKVDGYLDATHLRGGNATPDKADYGVITVEATKSDLEKLDPIITSKFGIEIPTHAHHVYKNRGNKYKKVIIWTCTDLGNMRVKDCFVTTQDYEEIYVEPIIL